MKKIEKVICRVCGKVWNYEVGSRGKGTKQKCLSCMANGKRYELKLKMVEYKGGKCVVCGYNKCLRALGFHHRDEGLKEFGVSSGHCRSWEAIKKELDKCDMLCANCHMERHDAQNPVKERIVQEAEYRKLNPVPAKLSRVPCPVCGKQMSIRRKSCSVSCAALLRRKVSRPNILQLKKECDTMPMTKVGEKYGVTDNTIRKWLKGTK